MTDTNNCLKTYCQQKNLNFIDKSNILEGHLGNTRGNSVSAWSAKSKFLLIVTFYLKKNLKTEVKNLYHSSHTITLSKGNIFDKKYGFFTIKNANISNIKGVLVLKIIFSETYVPNFKFLT